MPKPFSFLNNINRVAFWPSKLVISWQPSHIVAMVWLLYVIGGIIRTKIRCKIGVQGCQCKEGWTVLGRKNAQAVQNCWHVSTPGVGRTSEPRAPGQITAFRSQGTQPNYGFSRPRARRQITDFRGPGHDAKLRTFAARAPGQITRLFVLAGFPEFHGGAAAGGGAGCGGTG